MLHLPKFKRITDAALLAEYSRSYESCSGLPIPQPYLESSNNRVFAIYRRKQLIGGFILGNEPDFRTLHCFARAEAHERLRQRMGPDVHYSEICCFFIAPEIRRNTRLNLFVWLALTFAIRCYGRKRLLFGTNSPSLARLYGQTHHSRPFHEDQIEGKRTFLFLATRRQSVWGMLEIIRHKLKRSRQVKRSLAQKRMAA